MDQIKPVRTEKHEIEQRHVSNLLILFRKVWTPQFLKKRFGTN